MGKDYIYTLLKSKLSEAEALFFDEYHFINAPKDLIGWVKEGADDDEWGLEPLISDTQTLLNQDQKNLSYILLDYPFTYMNSGMKSFIDFAIYTPLDVAMARRLLRDYSSNQDIINVQKELKYYLNHGRR